MRMSGVRATALGLAALLAFAGVVSVDATGELLAGDAKVADALFKSGRQAYQKGDFSSAATLFQKTYDESPELIEAIWWRASSQEKAGDKPGALASYREFVTLFDGKYKSGATISKEEQRLKGLAEKCVDALSGADKDFRKLEDAYIASMLAFAKDNFVRDPSMSTRAIEAVLALRPDHEEARRVREKLSGGTGEAPAKGPVRDPKNPFAGVSTWLDLVAQPAFKSEHVTHAKGVMVLDVKGGN